VNREPNVTFEATYGPADSGLAGTVEVAIQDNQNNVVYGPTTASIIELSIGGSPTGFYRAILVAPADEGDYSILWSDDGSFDDTSTFSEDLTVKIEPVPVLSSLPGLGDAIADSEICSAWTSESDILNCCNAEGLGTSDPRLDQAIVAASEELYRASGKRWPGVCERTVRPRGDMRFCGLQVLSRGHVVGWDWGRGCWVGGGLDDSCRPLSRVKLAGNVRSIVNVKIDGAAIDPDTYEVVDHVYLIRKDGARWPNCQFRDRDDTESGTFSVTYEYGKVPPVAGQLAAQQLACEIFKSCTGQECSLPIGVTRITRAGLTIERSFLQRDRDGVWKSGLGMVDIFLNNVNPHGIPRRGTFWSASSRGRYARPEGE
jgi:hypothetical protein